MHIEATIIKVASTLAGHCQGEQVLKVNISVSIVGSDMYPSLLESFSHVLHRLPPLGTQLKGSQPCMLRYGAGTCVSKRHADHRSSNAPHAADSKECQLQYRI